MSPDPSEPSNLAEWARSRDIPYNTAFRLFEQGALPVPAIRVGRRIYVGEKASRLIADKARWGSVTQ